MYIHTYIYIWMDWFIQDEAIALARTVSFQGNQLWFDPDDRQKKKKQRDKHAQNQSQPAWKDAPNNHNVANNPFKGGKSKQKKNNKKNKNSQEIVDEVLPFPTKTKNEKVVKKVKTLEKENTKLQKKLDRK